VSWTSRLNSIFSSGFSTYCRHLQRPVSSWPKSRQFLLSNLLSLRIWMDRKVASILQQAGYSQVVSIPHANVPIGKPPPIFPSCLLPDTYCSIPPIVSALDPQTRLHIDININDRLGLKNTHLIATYLDLQPSLRPLLFVLKTWAKGLGLNDPSAFGMSSTFSSYCFGLMGIGFMQVRFRSQLLPPSFWSLLQLF
jgi:hypothetical protein